MIRACKKALSLLLIVLLFFNQLIFAPAVFADITSTSSATLASPDPSLTPSPTPTPTVTPTPKPTIAPSPSATTAATLVNSTQSVVSSSPVPEPTPSPVASDWQQNSDGSQTTVNNVELNKVYVAPQDGKVTVKFDKLTTPGKLTIKKVSTQNLTGVNPVSDTAYDISSGMQNGTFDYTLTLPTTKTQNVEVKASEDGKTFTTLGNVTAQTDTLTIASLNHFTLFVITGTASSSFNESSSSLIINEFLYNPTSGNEWVELYNKTGSSVDLTSWKLVDAANNVKNLSGSVPANGFYVYEASSWLNNTGQESIYLKDSGNNTIDEVTYESGSSTTIIGPQNLGGVPNGTQSVARTTDGGATWAIATPTKGWSDALSAPTAVYVNSSYVGVNTGTQNQPFTTIASAISLVAMGGTVNVADGTYAGALNITRSLVLNGTNQAGTIIDTSGTNGYGIHIQANNVTIQNLTVIGPQVAPFSADYGMKIEGSSGINLNHITVQSSKKSGIDLNGVNNSTFANITVQNNAANGFALTDSSNDHIQNITTSGNSWGGIAIYVKGSFYPGGSDNTTIDGTNSFGDSTKLYTEVDNATYHITNVHVQSSDFPYFTSFPTNPNGFTNVYFGTQAAAITGALTDPTHSYITSTSDGSLYVASGLKIQNAINAAPTSGTVSVATGTYIEQLTITKILTLSGTSSIIQAPAVLVGDTSGFKNIITISGASTNANISGFTISGPGPSGCGSINTGIFVRDGARVNIHGNTIQNISDNPLSGCQNGQGIFVGRAAFGTTGTATITNNTITGYQKGGIVIDNTGSSATITGNTVTGVGPTAMIAQNGIQVSRGATATVTGNTISGNECNYLSCGANFNTQDQSVGVLLFGAGVGTTVFNNSITNNDLGVYVDTIESINNNSISSNRFENLENESGATINATNNDWGIYTLAGISNTIVSSDPVHNVVTFSPFIGQQVAVLAPTVTLDTTKTTVTVNNTTSASTINIPSNVTNPTLNVSGIATTSGGNTAATINGNITLNATTSVGTITVAIPAGITISGASANWNGVINAPTLVNPSSVTLPSAPSGQTNTIAASVEVGFGNVSLTFNKGVRILLAGQAGKLAGYVRNGLFTAINNTCASDSQATGDALAGGECKIDVGSDMVIWTQHFTQFVSYSQNVQVSRGGGGFVSDGLGCGSHDCNTARQTPQGQVLGVTTKLASLPFESGIAEQEVQGAATTSEKVEKGEVKAASTIAPVSTPKAKTESNSKSSGPIGAIRDFFAAIVGFILRLFGK